MQRCKNGQPDDIEVPRERDEIRLRMISLIGHALDRLEAVGYYPILLLGSKKKSTFTADVISSIGLNLHEELLGKLKEVFGSILKLHSRNLEKEKAAEVEDSIPARESAGQEEDMMEQGPLESDTVVLTLTPCVEENESDTVVLTLNPCVEENESDTVVLTLNPCVEENQTVCEDSAGPDAAVTESTMDVAECEDMAQTTFSGDLVQHAEHVKDTKNTEVVPKKKGRKSCQKTHKSAMRGMCRADIVRKLSLFKDPKKRGDLLDRLEAVGYYPILLLGSKKKSTFTADVISSIGLNLHEELLGKLKEVFGSILKLHSRNLEKEKAAEVEDSIPARESAGQEEDMMEQGPLESDTVVLTLTPCVEENESDTVVLTLNPCVEENESDTVVLTLNPCVEENQTVCEDSAGPDAAVTESTMDVAECEDMAQTTFSGDLVQHAEHVKDTKNTEVVPKKKGRKSCQKTHKYLERLGPLLCFSCKKSETEIRDQVIK
ncbi:uncharacterized protein [Paramisgurnus dabryanus]|uniref:uncharacterized protein n=1 Tax=Paramisgurnus dabryanus TaxID=90735 RepID=UPI0031F40E27